MRPRVYVIFEFLIFFLVDLLFYSFSAAYDIKRGSQTYATPDTTSSHSFAGLTASSTHSITIKITVDCPGVTGAPYTAETSLIAYTKPAPPNDAKVILFTN